MRKDGIINKAIYICVEADKSLYKQTIKKGSANQKRYVECTKLIHETIRIFEQAMVERDSAELLEKGLNNLNQLDLKMQKMGNRYSPAHEIYPVIVKYAMENHADDADDFHGIKIPIPFPTPEEFLKFIKQLFQK